MRFNYYVSKIIYAIGKMWIFELMDLEVGGFENHGIYDVDYKEIVENFRVQLDGINPLCYGKFEILI